MIHHRIEPQDQSDDGRHTEDCNCDRCDPQECENCGKLLEDCSGNCIFDELPNRGFGDNEHVQRMINFAKEKNVNPA